MATNVPLFRVRMEPAAKKYAAKTFDSGQLAQGPMVERFEQSLQQYLKIPSTHKIITVCSGTAALDLALHLANIKAGDTVVSTPVTCSATNVVIANRQAHIAWADVDKMTGLIEPEDAIHQASQEDAKAIIGVNWAGQEPDYKRLRESKIPVIEDAAHSLHPVGDMENRGDYVCYSFQAIKHVTCGDGGAIIVPYEEVERAKRLRWFGLDRTTTSTLEQRLQQLITESGFKYHMNDIAASIGLGNLEKAEENIAAGWRNAATYDFAFNDGHATEGCWFYPTHVPNRDAFVRHMQEHDVTVSRVHMRNDVHPAFQQVARVRTLKLSGVDAFTETNIGLPCGWWVTEKDVKRIAKLTQEWIANQ